MNDRSVVCSSCRGVVSIPARSRSLTLEQVMAAHEKSCPGHGVKR